MDGINWGGLQQRNVFADFPAGQELGRERAEENARRRAANLFATDPAAAEQEFLRIGDMRSAEAVRKRREERETKDRQGLVNVVTQTKGPGVAAQKAAQVGEFDLAKSLMEMDKAQRAQVAEITDTAAAILYAYKDATPEQIAAAKPRIDAQLQARGIDPAKFDYTAPGAVQGLINESLGVKDLIAQLDRQQDNARADAQFEETKRSNRARESVAAGNLAERRAAGARATGRGASSPTAKLPPGFILD
ncbi:hypothetical protein [Phenylobacterium sp. J367]|uniref:hypothetical protein n=1 Tax=Phenylobacterium sp. J367 TaxID=2898435 RepID=UPI00215121C2|nr:hypothetical protein [Phenylobacterium sp. J367]MCR5876992.1 hypothetical protein [Phenylobacterium sp. J367]